MATRYIKANRKVAEYVRHTSDRRHLADGNYLLWQADIKVFGSLTQLAKICAQIGALALTAREARQEQDGAVLRTLPTATDDRFIMATASTEEEVTEETTTTTKANETTAAEDTTDEETATEETEAETTEETAEDVETTTEDVETVTDEESTTEESSEEAVTDNE